MSDKKIIPEINYMLTQEGCGACAHVKELLKNEINKGKIVPLDIKTPLGLKLVGKFNVEGTPVIINKKDKFEQVCQIAADAKSMFCSDGSEKRIMETK